MDKFARGGLLIPSTTGFLPDVEETILPPVNTKGMFADVVQVVRCKDCKYYREGEIFKDTKFCFRLRGDNDKPVGYNFSEDDFCSRGERKDNERKAD